MSTLTRRRFLGRLGASALLPAGLIIGASAPPPRRPADVPRATPPLPKGRLEELARLIRQTPRERIFDLAVDRLREDFTYRDVLGATFLAGVHDIRPRPVGFKLHAVMMVPSALQLAEGTSPEHRLLPIFFNLDDFKLSQDSGGRAGDWFLPPRPAAPPGGPEDAGRALIAALENWQEGPADRAVVGLHARSGLDEAFELLWPYGARDYRNIGHKIIFTTAVYRALRMTGWDYGEPALRSLVYGLLYGGAGETTADFERNRKLARDIGAGWDGGRRDPQASVRLLEQLRGASPEQAARQVVALLDGGVASDSIWDGLRLAASELLLRDPGILAVHPVTALNAFHFACRTTRNDETRRVMLLQSASWLPLFREELRRRGNLPDQGRRIDALTPPAGDAPESMEETRRLVFRKGDEPHAYKLSASVLEDQEHAHAEWRPRLLEAARAYLPTSRAQDAAVYGRMRRALQRLPIAGA